MNDRRTVVAAPSGPAGGKWLWCRPRRHRLGIVVLLLALVMAAAAPAQTAAQTPVEQGPIERAIGQRLAALDAGQREIGGARIVAGRYIAAFYAARDNRPAWFATEAGDALHAAIATSGRHGFRTDDFHGAALERLARAAAAGGDSGAIADYEIVASDAVARYIHHLYRGKVDPETLDPEWNFDRPEIAGEPASAISTIVDAGRFAVLIERLQPRHPQYLAIQAALERYREIEALGGWSPVPPGPTLKPGMSDPRIGALRARLGATGDLTPAAVSPAAAADTLFDPLLAAAVERFQARHGLDADGVVGPRTLAALNRPVGERIDQLRASLERGRWLLRGLAGDFVLVNIAGARTYLFRDGVPVWRARSIIGREYRKTPVFRDAIRYMELNPTWTVPRSIFLRDLLPRIRREPGYLAEGGFSVLDRQGQRLDPATVDWSLDDPGVTLVQAPGPRNALGQIKFMFPNRFAVYLHDTPDRGLFERADRALSSGCVRIEHPFVLADLIMAGSPDWSPERRQAILASGRTTRVDLPAPLPVLLTYYTAWVEDGEVLFRDDIYGRDGPLLAALDAPLGGRDAAR